MYLWYRTLSQHDEFEKAAIPVEYINGDVLLISGIKDQIWRATYMSEQIISRLHIIEFEYYYEHIAIQFAGHGIADPPRHPRMGLTVCVHGVAVLSHHV
ncbi:acyl-CoA thioester hydrolase/BAAT C-terminal domain-containing protein [uncultured Eudoraea sp.]|uniref:acyl-CoA thioester hydrolase/BAAT C-terminal domain-containing protein n=1 Tax=uncultured Eudoraea sp. TaxID=1035614 RepID=UPI00261B9A50|nr:acyl-CoA thioester hydrolase/BAAT C-terminal domain-containing protein [uncultured Eudoraea sp.]